MSDVLHGPRPRPLSWDKLMAELKLIHHRLDVAIQWPGVPSEAQTEARPELDRLLEIIHREGRVLPRRDTPPHAPPSHDRGEPVTLIASGGSAPQGPLETEPA